MLLYLESFVCNERTLDKAFLTNLAKIVGMVSKVGGLTKFPDIQVEFVLTVRRLVQNSLYLTRNNDWSIVDLLNGAIYSKVQSEFLTAQEC